MMQDQPKPEEIGCMASYRPLNLLSTCSDLSKLLHCLILFQQTDCLLFQSLISSHYGFKKDIQPILITWWRWQSGGPCMAMVANSWLLDCKVLLFGMHGRGIYSCFSKIGIRQRSWRLTLLCSPQITWTCWEQLVSYTFSPEKRIW